MIAGDMGQMTLEHRRYVTLAGSKLTIQIEFYPL